MTEPSPAEALKEFREKHGLSRKDLAEKIEVERMTVWRWEAGKRRIDADKVPLLVSVTGIPATTWRPDLARLLAVGGAE
jgi:transcriptional regulator with XRE-family HTH domain